VSQGQGKDSKARGQMKPEEHMGKFFLRGYQPPFYTVFKPAELSFQDIYLRMMQGPIKDSRGDCVFAHKLSPLTEGLVVRDDYRSFFVTHRQSIVLRIFA
jgi:hypothetical protein